MVRLLSLLITLGVLGGGGAFVFFEKPDLYKQILGYFQNESFSSLEVRFTEEQILKKEGASLLRDKRQSFLPAVLEFYPYALFEIKYAAPDDKTYEGLLLWGLSDGEIVLDTTTWETTNGYADCLESRADKQDLAIIRALYRAPGQMLVEESLGQASGLKKELLPNFLEKCKKKKLIVQTRGAYRLHLFEPKLTRLPETKINQWLITKSYNSQEKVSKKFSLRAVEKMAHIAFDNELYIKNVQEIYLPVYRLTVQNPDGTRLIAHYNALNGMPLHIKRLYS
jgi:hypothetical protein